VGARLVRRTTAAAAIAGLAGLSLVALPYTRAASFVARVADVGGWRESAAEWSANSFTTREVLVATRAGRLRARIYAPSSVRFATVLVPGIHSDGFDERRLVGFARELAASGVAVLTPQIPELARFRITPAVVDRIEDAAGWLADRTEYAPQGRVGLMGISFSGGLSVVAAGRPAVRDRIAFVFSLGGHGDLERVLRFLCTGTAGDGSSRRPHDYGLAVIVVSFAPRLVPPEQVPGLVEGAETFLEASALAHRTDPRARERFVKVDRIASSLGEPAAELLRLVSSRDVDRLGARLLPHVPGLVDPALSPERTPAPSSPVYLLHGTDDAVVPAAESLLLGRHLQERQVETHVLLSPLITHAEVDRAPDLADSWRLIGFWKDLLDQ
jgi:dienelactone hydrolase